MIAGTTWSDRLLAVVVRVVVVLVEVRVVVVVVVLVEVWVVLVVLVVVWVVVVVVVGGDNGGGRSAGGMGGSGEATHNKQKIFILSGPSFETTSAERTIIMENTSLVIKIKRNLRIHKTRFQFQSMCI